MRNISKKLQQGAMSLTEMAIAVGIVAVISSVAYLNYNPERQKADLVLAKQREVASALLRMKADFSCYPQKLSALTIAPDAAANACGGVNDVSQWKGPYLASAKYLADGSLDMSDISADASLSLISVGNSWALKTNNIPSSLINNILSKCPKSDTCLEVTTAPPSTPVTNGTPIDNEIMSTRQHALVFDGQLASGAALGTIVVNNQTAVAAVSPSGAFAPITSLVGNTTYASAAITAVATAPVSVGPTPVLPPAAAPAVPSPAPAPSSPFTGLKSITLMGLNMNAGPDTAHPFLGTIIASTPGGLSCMQEDISNVVGACGAAANGIISSDTAAIQSAFAPAFSQLYSDMVAVTFPPSNLWTWTTTIPSSSGRTITLTLSSVLVGGWTPYYTVDVTVIYN